MAFAQLTYRESLRDIETCLRAHQDKLYHLGIRGRVSRSTLADANEQRDWRIYADFGMRLIQIARSLYADDSFAVELEHTLTPWIPPPSTYASRCFRGRASVPPRQR